MKKIITLLTIILVTITSCNNGHKFTLKGDIENLTVDTILVYYQSPYNKLDTIIAKEGKFEYSIPADTITIFSLFINHNKEIPIFAYKDGKAKIEGRVNNFIIEGEKDNMKMNEIFDMERKMKNDTASIQKWIETFSKNNPASYTNVYLLNNYFIQVAKPDYKKINNILKNIHGNIKDVPLLERIQKDIINRITTEQKNIQSISIPDKNGKYPIWNILSDKVSLITFWASWDEESKNMQDSIAIIKKGISNKDFQVLSISLDYDKLIWKSNLPQDTVKWQQLCDFKGWDGSFVKKINLSKLPYTIILGRNRQIVASDIYGNDLKKKINETLDNKDK